MHAQEVFVSGHTCMYVYMYVRYGYTVWVYELHIVYELPSTWHSVSAAGHGRCVMEDSGDRRRRLATERVEVQKTIDCLTTRWQTTGQQFQRKIMLLFW